MSEAVYFRPVGSQFSVIGVKETPILENTIAVSQVRLCITRVQGTSVDLEFYPYDPLAADDIHHFNISTIASRVAEAPEKLSSLYFTHRTGIQLADAQAAISELELV